MIIEMDGVKWKVCTGGCNETKLSSDFYVRGGKRSGELKSFCKVCETRRSNEYHRTHLEWSARKARESSYRTGRAHPWRENKSCSVWLGEIAERICVDVFGVVNRMPHNNKGYDMVCGRGYKVDVKAACIFTKTYQYKTPKLVNGWFFRIRRNEIADYVVCIGFNNDRERLEVLRAWVIPGRLVRGMTTIHISADTSKVHKWDKYEYPIEKIRDICMTKKGELVK
jgi:hypothetical protein